jgi:outer membrane receptor for ferrienterochelin and colicins
MDKSTGISKISDGYMLGYHTLNVTMSRPFFKNRLDVSTGGKNLFNNTNITSFGAGQNVHGGGDGDTPVGWGRTFFIRLTYNLISY